MGCETIASGKPQQHMLKTRSSLSMRQSVGVVAVVVVVAAIMPGLSTPVSSQAAVSTMPRTADGRPDFSGFWQAMTSAYWDIEAHEARKGPVVALGAAYGYQAGLGIVEGGQIPYLPEAAARRKANAENVLALDPEVKCYLPGTPRVMYMPYPFQIVQGREQILIASEFAAATRNIRMNTKARSPLDTWMGWSVGHWERDTLVVEVTDFNDQTWFDRAGNFHSEALKVVERYRALDRNTISYEATIEDPKTFSRPWKINVLLYRHQEKNYQLFEYRCQPFAEEVMYGHLRKREMSR